MESFTVEGKTRQRHRHVEYKNACLPSRENKLLFILTYLKGNDLQERIAEMFGISQPKANVWIHLLHKVLNQALNEIEVLPARDADSLEKKLDKLAIDSTTTDTTEVEALALEANIFSPTVEAAKLEAVSPTVEATPLVAETVSPTVEATPLVAETVSPTVEAIESEATESEAETLETTDDVETMVEIDLYLHDGFERPINRPLNKAIQEIFSSGKPKKHTVKNV